MTEITIPLRSHDEAILVLGPYDRYAKLLRQDLDIELFTRRGNLRIKGDDDKVVLAKQRIEHLLGKKRKGRELSLRDIEAILVGSANGGENTEVSRPPADEWRPVELKTSGTQGWPSATSSFVKGMKIAAVQPRTENQRRYLEQIDNNTLVFGLGVAGTGKTFLAVTAAVRALRSGQCKRLVITRPVVEAGERLGFLPGDLQAKLNPYMRPIYDALYELIGPEEVTRLEEGGVIEVAPLAYMRGRTLSRAFVILDEAQNASISQMKMFLTRLGEGSHMVVTGDPSQTDLEGGQKSGLADAARRLRGFEGVGVVEFQGRDVVRHPLVVQIVRAYEAPSRPAREED